MIQQDYEYNAKVTNVVDGDTIDLDIDLGFYIHSFQRVRLAGLDTPEVHSTSVDQRTKAQLAKVFVQQTVFQKNVVIKSFKQDKYGRFLAEVFIDNQSLNAMLLNKGLALPYGGGKKQGAI